MFGSIVFFVFFFAAVDLVVCGPSILVLQVLVWLSCSLLARGHKMSALSWGMKQCLASVTNAYEFNLVYFNCINVS